MWAKEQLFSVCVFGLFPPSSPESVGSGWLRTGDGRDVGGAGGHRCSATKDPSAAAEGQDRPMAASHHVHHLLVQPAVGHVYGKDGITASKRALFILNNTIINQCFSLSQINTFSFDIFLKAECLKSSPPSPVWVNMSSLSPHLHCTHGLGPLSCPG